MQISVAAPTSIASTSSIQSSEFYESAIAADENAIDNYWYLGISYLLSGREDDAQAAWFAPLSAANSDEIDAITEDLLLLLEREANFQAQIPDLEKAWLLRQHLWSLAPDRVINVLRMIIIAQELDLLTEELLAEWQLDELLAIVSVGDIEISLVEETISVLLINFHTELSLQLIASCLRLVGDLLNTTITKVVVAVDRKSTRLNSSHRNTSRMPSSA